MTLRPTIIPRSAWMKGPLGSKMRNLPLGNAFVHHTARPPSSDPIADAQYTERIGIKRFGRLSYSCLIHVPSLSILIGQWERLGVHTKGWNSKSISFSFMDNYATKPAGELEAHLLAHALRAAAENNVLSLPGLLLRPHHAVRATECPGQLAGQLLRGLALASHWENPLDLSPFVESPPEAVSRPVAPTPPEPTPKPVAPVETPEGRFVSDAALVRLADASRSLTDAIKEL